MVLPYKTYSDVWTIHTDGNQNELDAAIKKQKKEREPKDFDEI